MSELGKRLREARERLGWTQAEAAEQIGTTRQVVSQWEVGHRAPAARTIARLAEIYRVNAAWLMGQSDNPTPPSTRGTAGLAATIRRIPVVARLAAGSTHWSANGVEGFLDIAVPELPNLHGELFGVIVEDDTMLPSWLKRGDIAVVEATSRLEPGSIGLVAWPGVEWAQIRRVYREDRDWVLLADHPDVPPAVVQARDLRIFGRVVSAFVVLDRRAPEPEEVHR